MVERISEKQSNQALVERCSFPPTSGYSVTPVITVVEINLTLNFCYSSENTINETREMYDVLVKKSGDQGIV